MPRPFVLDTVDGVTSYAYLDPTDGRFVYGHRADVEPNIEANKALAKDGTGGWSPTREFKRVASIPVTVALMWKERFGIDAWDQDHWPAVLRLLDDPDWRFLRTDK